MSEETVKIGLMPPLSGLVGIYGSEIVHAGQVACQEVNDNGGVLGRPLELIIEDDCSLPESAVAAAEKLLDEHQCVAIIGNLLSNSRIAVAYRVAEPRRIPYLNFSFYEGSILSRYFFHFAALPNQQIDKMIPYMRNKFGPRMFFAGNNYEWPRGSIHAGKLALEKAGGEVVGEEYCPIGVNPELIEHLLDQVEAANPDVFVPYFAGNDQVLLLKRFSERGLKKRMAVVMGHYDEMMASQLPAEVREGFYSSNTYFMTIDSEQNRNYLARLASLPDVTGIWPQGNGIITNFGEGAYVCVKAFAEAANKAGSLDPEILVVALQSVSIEAPQGKVTMHAGHHHARVNTYLTQCNAAGEFNVVKKFGTIEPVLPQRYNHQRISHQATIEEDIRLQARILEQLSEGILLVSSGDNSIIYANAGADSIFGYGTGEIIGLNISSLIDPAAQDPDERYQAVLSSLNQKGSWEGELPSVRRGGATLLCSAKISVFTHPIYGEVSLGVYRDITERKKNEESLNFNHHLSQGIARTLSLFISDPDDVHTLFTQMLGDLLALTGSEYGFIGEIFSNEEGVRYLKTHAITNIAWNDETHELYNKYGKTGFEFTNLNTLFGITIRGDQVVISNDPLHDGRSGGLPEGHPALNAYMGIPLIAGNTNIGMIGIANREGGYNENLIEKINPLLQTFVNVIINNRSNLERKQLASQLRSNEVSLLTAQYISHVGSWVWDIQTGQLEWSDEIYRIFGHEPQAFKASYDGFLEHVHPEDVQLITNAVGAAIGNERADYDIHHRIIRSSGEIRFVHETGVVFTDNNNAPVRMIGAVHDITERILYQENLEKLVAERTHELRAAQDELIRKERLATLGQLTATVSHELRNPLGAIRPSLFVIEKKTAELNDETLTRAVERVERNIGRCDQIIDELLDFTRITEINITPVEIDKWITIIISEQIISPDIQLATEWGTDNSTVAIDSSRFRRAFINVFENATHALLKTDNSGEYTKTASLHVKTHKDADRFVVSITDNGYGIPENVMQRIFEPLFSTKGFGVGLGMPTVKQIMEQHNGGINIVSEQGKGTTVSLWLPLANKNQGSVA